MIALGSDSPAAREASTPSAPTPSGLRLLLGLLLLWCLLLRGWYGSAWPDADRFYDERFSFENVTATLQAGRFQPGNGYYPTLAWLPQTLLLAASDALERRFGLEGLAIRGSDGDYSSHAYLLCRGVMLLYAMLGLWLLYRIGSRLFSPRVGLLALAILAAAPWHLHASVKFKPDILLVLTILLTLDWSLLALRNQRPASFALAGAGIALAMSSKLTGGLAALPLVLLSLARGWRERRSWLLLLLAGAVALLLWLLLNPQFSLYLDYMQRLTREYDERAGDYGGTRLSVLWRLPELLLGWEVHGLVLGAVAVLGGGLWLHRLWRQTLRDERWWQRLMPPLLLFCYAGGYALVTPHFKPNNFLPLMPLSALFAAWLLARVGSGLARRWPPLRGRAGGLLALALAAVWLLPRPFLYAYRSLTPSTHDVAREFLAKGLEGSDSRIVLAESWQQPVPAWEGAEEVFRNSISSFELVEALHGLPVQQLERADAELFLASRLDGPQAGFYRDRMQGAQPRLVQRFEPWPFRLRGPALIALRHRWDQQGITHLEFRSPPRGGRYAKAVELPEPRPLACSLVLWFPYDREGNLVLPRVVQNGRELDPSWSGTSMGGHLFMSQRVLLEQPRLELELVAAPGWRPRAGAVDVYWWSGRNPEWPWPAATEPAALEAGGEEE